MFSYNTQQIRTANSSPKTVKIVILCMRNIIFSYCRVIMPLISAFILIFASCKPEYLTTDGETWGTYYHIVYSCESLLDDSIKSELLAIDNEFSLFNPNSTVSLINSGSSDRVGERFITVFEMCRLVNGYSQGEYDPTVGPVANLWGFGKKEIKTRPGQMEIDSALACVGLRECAITSDNRIVKKSAGTTFDFSSIAKGFGIDCIAAMMERNGCNNYMIEIGGEIAAKGVSPKGQPWRIQVDSPASGLGHDVLDIVELGPEYEALASSGNYRNFINLGDTLYGHTISPLTGYPVKGTLLSVTIKTGSCAIADALATACMASGSWNAAEAVIRKSGVDALVVEGDSLGKFNVIRKGM